MANTKTLQKILVGLLIILLAIVLITLYRMYMIPKSVDVPVENTAEVSVDEFGGASEEELQALLDTIAPVDGSGGLSEEEMAAALADIREGEEGAEVQPDATPEGEVKPLTEAEVQARLQELREEESPSDNDTPATPE